MKAGPPERRDDLARTPTARDAGSNRILQALTAPALISLSTPARYAVAPLGPLFAVLVQYALLPEPAIAPFNLFYFSVALVALVAGHGPGLLSVALSALVANYLFVTPYRHWTLSGPALTATVLFVIGGSAVSLLCASFRNALLTSRRTAEVLRRQAELLHLSHDAILVWRTGGGIETWNRGAEELYGFTGDEARGRLPQDLLQTIFLTPLERFEATLREQGRWEGELEHRTRDGRTVTVSAKLQLVRGPDGVERVLATNRDITERKQAERALRDADRRKDEFLAMLSHELRNPLAPILGAIYILDRAAPGSDQARKAQAVIARQVRHLGKLVDDLLDVTRISRGKISLRRERMDIRELVHRAGEDYQELFTHKGVGLEVAVGGDPLHVNGDATRLSQVIGNLLHNAARFTPRGGRVTLTLSRADGGFATVAVRDTGAGIAPEMLPRLFQPFTQGERTLDRSAGGLGLGLALVKALVELHGGSASARSEGADRGAEFVLQLPLDMEERPQAPPGSAPMETTPAGRVLLIEDNVDWAETLKTALEMDGHSVEIALTGLEGIEKARASRPDVVLCDIGLPRMDGYEVARTMRRDHELRSIPLVAVSGYAAPEDVESAKRAGFDVHLAKPPDLEILRRVMTQVLTGSSSDSSSVDRDRFEVSRLH
jgi:two-component system CheB/CheR fusion protein